MLKYILPEAGLVTSPSAMPYIEALMLAFKEIMLFDTVTVLPEFLTAIPCMVPVFDEAPVMLRLCMKLPEILSSAFLPISIIPAT